ncbi:MAG: cyclodeaminase/cyclohydrolase family protein [Candidatus Izemoplasma sp.]
MKLIDMTVTEFINKVASATPAPGGGSVSALASSLGIALLRMSGELTVTKKKFGRLEDSIKEQYISTFNSFEERLNRLQVLIDLDTNAFNEIMNAYRLPKDSDKEVMIRKTAILKATIYATEVPLEVAQITYSALQDVELFVKYGNKNTLGDIGVSVLNLCSGIEGALLNVRVNLPGLVDETMINMYQEQISSIQEGTNKIKAYLNKLIDSLL